MSRVYEVMFIVRPDVAEEDADKLIDGFKATVTHGGGVVKNVEKMGRRKLAYTVRKFDDGNFLLFFVGCLRKRVYGAEKQGPNYYDSCCVRHKD